MKPSKPRKIELDNDMSFDFDDNTEQRQSIFSSNMNQTIDDKAKISDYVEQMKAASARQDPAYFIQE